MTKYLVTILLVLSTTINAQYASFDLNQIYYGGESLVFEGCDFQVLTYSLGSNPCLDDVSFQKNQPDCECENVQYANQCTFDSGLNACFYECCQQGQSCCGSENQQFCCLEDQTCSEVGGANVCEDNVVEGDENQEAQASNEAEQEDQLAQEEVISAEEDVFVDEGADYDEDDDAGQTGDAQADQTDQQETGDVDQAAQEDNIDQQAEQETGDENVDAQSENSDQQAETDTLDDNQATQDAIDEAHDEQFANQEVSETTEEYWDEGEEIHDDEAESIGSDTDADGDNKEEQVDNFENQIDAGTNGEEEDSKESDDYADHLEDDAAGDNEQETGDADQDAQAEHEGDEGGNDGAGSILTNLCEDITIYEDCNYEGTSQVITQDVDCLNFLPKSFCIPDGQSIEIFDICYFSGQNAIFYDSVSCLNHLDEISLIQNQITLSGKKSFLKNSKDNSLEQHKFKIFYE